MPFSYEAALQMLSSIEGGFRQRFGGGGGVCLSAFLLCPCSVDNVITHDATPPPPKRCRKPPAILLC